MGQACSVVRPSEKEKIVVSVCTVVRIRSGPWFEMLGDAQGSGKSGFSRESVCQSIVNGKR